MFEKCPFYPSAISPPCRNCQFLCNGGCAIQLAGYAYDAFKNTKEIKEKLERIDGQIDDLKRKISS